MANEGPWELVSEFCVVYFVRDANSRKELALYANEKPSASHFEELTRGFNAKGRPIQYRGEWQLHEKVRVVQHQDDASVMVAIVGKPQSFVNNIACRRRQDMQLFDAVRLNSFLNGNLRSNAHPAQWRED